jgi:uncharacterized protein (TIGR02246 family)
VTAAHSRQFAAVMVVTVTPVRPTRRAAVLSSLSASTAAHGRQFAAVTGRPGRSVRRCSEYGIGELAVGDGYGTSPIVLGRPPGGYARSMTANHDVDALYRKLLLTWNEKDATGYGELFTDSGTIVGYDGSCVETPASITQHLASIFADHETATYVAKVLEIRPVGDGAMLLRGVVGMVPPGSSDIAPDRNAVQALVAVQTARGWRIAHFQNTPAAFHGRPEAVESLTADLRAVLAAS